MDRLSFFEHWLEDQLDLQTRLFGRDIVPRKGQCEPVTFRKVAEGVCCRQGQNLSFQAKIEENGSMTLSLTDS